MLYLDRNRINYLRKDIDLLFVRFTRNKLGAISYLDFVEEVTPKI